MSRPPEWAISPLDTMTHLLPPLGDQSCWGVYRAYCGRLLPSFVTRFERPPHRCHCPGCEVMCRIVARPITSTRKVVDSGADRSALGRAGRAITGIQASARPAPEDAAWAGPADAADLPAVQAQRVFPGQ